MFKVGDRVKSLIVDDEGLVTAVWGDRVRVFFDTYGKCTELPDTLRLADEGPVRTETVTPRRIVPGVYGRLRVGQAVNAPDCARPDEPPRVGVDIELTGGYCMTADELDALADTARQLAEALRDDLD